MIHYQVTARGVYGGILMVGIMGASRVDALVRFYKIFPAGTLIDSVMPIRPPREREGA